MNSDIFEYCCFNGNVGDDVLMLYPAQNHFIEEYDPDDQYEIQEHFIVEQSSNQNTDTCHKEVQKGNSPQSSNLVNQMSNLNLSGCATTDLSHKSHKNAKNKHKSKDKAVNSSFKDENEP